MIAAASASRRVGHDYVGSEHLLLALAEDQRSAAARVLSANGLAAEGIQAEIIRLVGVCERRPDRMDTGALATIAIDLAEVRRQVEHAFGPGALERTWSGCTPPVAPRLKRALELAADEAGEIASEHALLGLAMVDDSLAAQILFHHAVTADSLRTELSGSPQ